ncbi:MAG: hypothetical protein P8171_07720 [Candidatus Thiodiazotropha sp.]
MVHGRTDYGPKDGEVVHGRTDYGPKDEIISLLAITLASLPHLGQTDT